MEYIPDILIHRFLQSAHTFPDRPSLRLDSRDYTYAELLKEATSYAIQIIETGEASPVIGVMASRSFETYAGILGILLAGKGYLPLNPSFPEERNGFILQKSGTHTVVTGGDSLDNLNKILASSGGKYNLVINTNEDTGIFDQAHLHSLLSTEEVSTAFKLPEIGNGDIAYLMFTSGSTGMPKGVAVSNRNVTTYLDNIMSLFGFFPEDRFSQTFDLTFDLSVHDLFVCWSAGACLCIPEDNSSFGLSRYLKQMQPTVWFSVPSVANLLDRMRLLREATFPWLRLSFFCGEGLPEETAMAWKKASPVSRIINLYGPTEATIAISAYVLPDSPGEVKSRNGIVSIGKPFPGHHCLLLGEQDDSGILCLSGPQVVDGYFEDLALTDEYFFEKGDDHVPFKTPFCFYNTGDLVEADEDGDFYFMGRKDSEVKISGYRVNLLEIDYVINAVHTIKQAVTLYLEDPGGIKALVSFAVLYEKKDDISDVIPGIFQHCRRHLPHFMVPEKIIFVDALPLNPNGKTDRRALSDIFRKHYEQGN